MTDEKFKGVADAVREMFKLSQERNGARVRYMFEDYGVVEAYCPKPMDLDAHWKYWAMVLDDIDEQIRQEHKDRKRKELEEFYGDDDDADD